MQSIPKHKILFDCITNAFKHFRFNYHKLQEKKLYGDYYFPYTKSNRGESINILANGPSLKKEIEELRIEGIKNRNSAVVNFFAISETFQEIKPEYYLLADRMFFLDENQDSNYGKVFEVFNNNVDWEMILIVPFKFRDKALQYVHNAHIKIECLSSLKYEGDEKRRFESWKKGESVPSYVNVVLMGEYYFLQKGYSSIYLYGVDHTFLQNLVVDDENYLCIADTHFYGTQKCRITDIVDGKEVRLTVADFVYNKYLTFKEHELMQAYSEYLGAQILNCTKCSMIDAYPRISQLKKEK